MNWKYLRLAPWIDTRTMAVRHVRPGGAVLDIGTSDGRTLAHFHEWRADLVYHAVDIAPAPVMLPPGCQFVQLDVTRDRLPWADGYMDAVMALQLIEHLPEWTWLFRECSRILRVGGCLFIEFPSPKTLTLPPAQGVMKGRFTMHFRDDPTHVRMPDMETLRTDLAAAGFSVVKHGTSRNLLFALAYALVYRLRKESRHQYIARSHWIGWSSYVCARKTGYAGRAE